MNILFWLIVGIVAGALAKALVPGEAPGGTLGDLLIGIVGAFIGGFVFSLLGVSGAGASTGYLWSIFVAFVGAAILLFVFRAMTTRRISF